MIAVVVPTCREEKITEFTDAWMPLIVKHEAILLVVHDGDNPTVEFNNVTTMRREWKTKEEIMGKYSDTIFSHTDSVRNLGFAYIAKYLKDIEIIITLDDDVTPVGDTIVDHMIALTSSVPVSWMSTSVLPDYMRGFPYGIRNEARVVLSHGVWTGTPDLDAPTQLTKPYTMPQFYKGPIPKGIYYPMSMMNIAFTYDFLPFMYEAPMGEKVGVDRFGDIWCGIETKKIIDEKGLAVVSGYATVNHRRASDVFVNLQKEGKGLSMNEHYGEDDYFTFYKILRQRWQDYICSMQA